MPVLLFRPKSRSYFALYNGSGGLLPKHVSFLQRQMFKGALSFPFSTFHQYSAPPGSIIIHISWVQSRQKKLEFQLVLQTAGFDSGPRGGCFIVSLLNQEYETIWSVKLVGAGLKKKSSGRILLASLFIHPIIDSAYLSAVDWSQVGHLSLS